MSIALFDLDDFTETRTEWVSLGWLPDRCGLCGVKCSMNQGGTDVGMVCDGCAQIDRCRIREHEAVVCRSTARGTVLGRLVARCLHCSWRLAESRWEEGASVPRTVEEVAAAMVEHVRPKHTSHWGESHEITAHDELVAAQAKRRASYLRTAEAA